MKRRKGNLKMRLDVYSVDLFSKPSWNLLTWFDVAVVVSKLCIVSFSLLMPFFLAIPQEFIDLPYSSVPLVRLCLFLIFDHCLIQDVYILTESGTGIFFCFLLQLQLKDLLCNAGFPDGVFLLFFVLFSFLSLFYCFLNCLIFITRKEKRKCSSSSATFRI